MEEMNEDTVRRMADCVINGGENAYEIQDWINAMALMDRLLRGEGVIGVSIEKDCLHCFHSVFDTNYHPSYQCKESRINDSDYKKVLLQRLDSARCILDTLRDKSRRDVECRDLRQKMEKMTSELTSLAATTERDFIESSRTTRMALQGCVESVKLRFFQNGGSVESWQKMVKDAVKPEEGGDSPPRPVETSSDWALPPVPASIQERRERGIKLNIEGLDNFPQVTLADIRGHPSAPAQNDDAGSSSDTASFVSTVTNVSAQWDYTDVPLRSASQQRRRSHSHERRRHSHSRRRRDSSGVDERRQRRSSSRRRRRRRHSRRRASTGSDPSPDRRASTSRRERQSPSRRHAVEQAVVPEVAALDLGNDVLVYPGFDEPEEEVTLTHMRGGPFCGGWAKDTVLRNLTRLTDKVDFTEKKEGESEPVCYLRHEAEWVSIAKSAINRDTQLYTIVACFANKMTEYTASLQPLLDRQGYFTSFKHFLREWRLVRWPHIRQAVMLEAEECRQLKKESIEKYFERFRTLSEIVGWNINDRVDWFVSGLRDDKIKEAVNQHHFASRSLPEVKQFAVDLTGRLEVAAAMEKRRGRDKVSMTASVAVAGVSPSASASRPASTTPSGNRKSRKAPKAASVSAATVVNYSEEKREEAAREMRKHRINGCYGCLQSHKFEGFETCASFCPFCDYTFKTNASRHFPMACNRRPATRREMIDAIKEAQKKASLSGAAK